MEDTTAGGYEGDYRTPVKGDFRLVLARSWFSLELVFLAFFCLAWDSFLVVWYSVAARVPGPMNIMAILFPLVHVAVGVSLTYRTIAGFLNKSRISVTPEKLTVRHGPVPWLGNCEIPSSEIAQLFCEQVTNRGRRGSGYTLSAVLRDGRKVTLLKSLPDWNQAIFIEQRVEACLGIQDARVGGEFMH